MFEEEKNKSSLISDEIKQLSKVDQATSGMSVFMERVHSINGVHFISALAQIFLGTCVVALSLINSIQPLWLATIMTVFGSITSMIGLYFMYYIFSHAGVFDSLLHKAIKRVINSQN
ncbi:MAG: hypothetical protein WD016_09205 [Balneolaceae bacterium]